MKALILLATFTLTLAAELPVYPQAEKFVAKASTQDDWERPAFCKGLECPRFKVVQKTKDYEVRNYEKSSWVYTSMKGMDYVDCSSVMFLRLFDYIQGDNERDQKIAMTAPVITRVIPGAGPACRKNFTQGFYIDPVVAKDPPKPEDEDVSIANMPAMTMYVRSFGGFATIDDFVQEVARLGAALPEDASFDKSYFITVAYDDPLSPFDRHNEVWLPAV